MPASNWDRTTDKDRPEVVICDETNDYQAEVTHDKELKVYQDKPIITRLENSVAAGIAFLFSDFDTLGNGETYDFVITTPNSTKSIEAFISFITESVVEAYLYENPTLVKGALQTVYNRNRQSSTTPTATVHAVTSVSALGTLLASATIGSSGGKGGSTDLNQRWILKKNEEYLVRLTSGVASNDVSVAIDWFETED